MPVPSLPALLLFAVNLLLSLALVQEKKKSLVAAVQNAELAGKLNTFQRRASAFERVIYRQDLRQPTFLRGREVATRRTWQLDQAINGIYYVIDVRCPKCIANLAFLGRASGGQNVPIVGISFDDEGELLTFASKNKVEFPILSNPEGKLVSLLPGDLSPVTIVVRNGRIEAMLPGVLTPAEQQYLDEYVVPHLNLPDEPK